MFSILLFVFIIGVFIPKLLRAQALPVKVDSLDRLRLENIKLKLEMLQRACQQKAEPLLSEQKTLVTKYKLNPQDTIGENGEISRIPEEKKP